MHENKKIKWRQALLANKWLTTHEELAYRRILNRTNKINPMHMGKYLFSL
jgi:hypothetical protein